jgi:hypothetical protein
MIPYYSLCTLLGFVSITDYFRDSPTLSKATLHKALFLLLLLFIGFRAGVGIDWVSYKLYYDNIEPLTKVIQGSSSAPFFFYYKSQNIEIGFKLLNSLFKLTTLDFKYFVFFISAFNLFSLYKFLQNKEILYKVTFLIIYLALSMFREFDILRQSLALYTFLFSIKYVNKNFWKYSLINLISVSFHVSAIIFFLIYPFITRIPKRNFLIALLLLYIISFFFTIPFISFLINFFHDISNLKIFTKLLEKYIYLYYPKGLGLTISIPCTILLVLLIAYYDKIKQFPKVSIILINMFLMYFVISILFAEIEEVVTRLGYFFHIGIAFVFSSVPLYLKRNSRILYSAVPITYLFVKIYLMMLTPATRYSYSPYYNYLFGVDQKKIDNQINLKKTETEKFYKVKIQSNDSKK